MVTFYNTGAYLINQNEIIFDNSSEREKLAARLPSGVPLKDEARCGTIAYSILQAHNTAPDMQKLKLKFDAMASHDITYVGIVQTARASGLESFPIPYVLTNCHNSLCAVGGTINEDDHLFGLSAAKKYGGIYVPAHQAVIHQYMREMMSSCGAMILGSDSHTRYGALGTLAIGEGGPELVKQLLSKTYDIDLPEVVAVYLTGSPKPGVGPQDVALAIIGEVFPNGGVKNKILEFVGEGIASLSADFRIGIDVMTTETTCLSSIWATDETIRDYFALHHRPQAFSPLAPLQVAYYDGIVTVDLSAIEPMIALPFHPSNTYTIANLNANLGDILNKVEKEGRIQLGELGESFNLLDKIKDGKLMTQQGIIAGCAGGTFENICAAADILGGRSLGDQAFALSVYPASQPINIEIANNGVMSSLLKSGAVMRTAFCGPCFGAGDVPANNTLSIRHATRNFPNREGSRPDGGQVASVALMDARSVAATALNGGILTPATEVPTSYLTYKYKFDGEVYKNRCYFGYKKAIPQTPLAFGPNIADWPKIEPLGEHLLLKVASFITDPITTTDELIPSGETSSYRSNPLKLAEFTLSRKDPGYRQRAKDTQALEVLRLLGEDVCEKNQEFKAVFEEILKLSNHSKIKLADLQLGSLLYANKPGDGSAREQAASCQKVLGTLANIAQEYATKRYRSNLINWGMLPFVCADVEIPFSLGDWLFIPSIRLAVINKSEIIPAYVIKADCVHPFNLILSGLTADERSIILSGCLINYYRGQ